MHLKETLLSNKIRLVATFGMLKDKYAYLESKINKDSNEYAKKELQQTFEATEAIRLYSQSSDNYIAFLENYLSEQLKIVRDIEEGLSIIEVQSEFNHFKTIAELRNKLGKKGLSLDQIAIVKTLVQNIKKSHGSNKA
jgi:hypothetical protein